MLRGQFLQHGGKIGQPGPFLRYYRGGGFVHEVGIAELAVQKIKEKSKGQALSFANLPLAFLAATWTPKQRAACVAQHPPA